MHLPVTRGRRWILPSLGALLLVIVAAGAAFWWWGLHTPVYPLPELTGTVVERRLEFGGLSRSFLVYVPRKVVRPTSVVLVLHGSGGTAQRMRRDTGWAFEEIADRDGVLIVYPQGHQKRWQDCRRVLQESTPEPGIDDVGFLRAVVARLAGDPALEGRQIDADQVFAAGFSNGGQMAFRLALEAPDFVTGIAAIAASLPTSANFNCHASGQAVAVLLIDGDDDPVSPYEGGEIRSLGPFNRRGAVRPVEATAEYFSQLAGYADPPFEHRYPDADARDGTVASRRVWSVENRPEIDLITIYGGGHTIPHPIKRMPRIFGRTSHDFSAAEEIWRFFGRQLLSGGQPD
ncbi:MAG: PHB depolymerase family esterase [Gammaproteobacteria bacterium]